MSNDIIITDEGRITVVAPTEPETIRLIVERGPQGPPGSGAVDPFEYVMPAAQTTALITHDLGYDPIVVQVQDADGVFYDEFSVTVTIPGSQILVGFDIAIAAIIRMI